MNNIKKQSILLIASVFAISNAYATQPSSTKAYTVTNLQRVVSNHANCQLVHHALQQFFKKPVMLQFSSNSDNTNFEAKDLAGKSSDHSYSIIKEDIKDNVVNRVSVGSFMLDKHKINYVVEISADISQKNFKYHYPIILDSESGHCYYTALVKPDAKTVAQFKNNIQNRSVAKGADLG
jgi:hypothetical protein